MAQFSPSTVLTGGSYTTLVLAAAQVKVAPTLDWFLLTNDNTLAGAYQFQDTNGVALTAAHYMPAPGGVNKLSFDGPKIFAASGVGIQLVYLTGMIIQISWTIVNK